MYNSDDQIFLVVLADGVGICFVADSVGSERVVSLKVDEVADFHRAVTQWRQYECTTFEVGHFFSSVKYL